jgi:hypothetical protein
LAEPIKEDAKQLSRSDTRILRELVGEVDEAGPDGFEAALEEIASLDSENGSPHERNEGANADGWE